MTSVSTRGLREHCVAEDMKKRLRYWHFQRFILNRQTTELMATTADARESEALGIVAMLDIRPDILAGMMPREKFRFIQACHGYLGSLKAQSVAF